MAAQTFKLTSTKVANLPFTTTGQKLYWDSDVPCFGVCVGTSTKSYFVQRRVDNKTRRVKLGRIHEMTSEVARNEARDMLTSMRHGKDPVKEKKEAAIKGMTFKEAYDEFYSIRLPKLSPTTLRGYNDLMKNHLSDWFNKALTDIDGTMITERHKKITHTGKLVAADNCMRMVSAIFNLAIVDNNALHNPVAVLTVRKMWGFKSRRGNWLREYQLKAWHSAVMNLNNQTIKDFLLFLLYSGLRKNEALKLKWSNVSIVDKSFVIPDTKNRIPHHLPLSEPLLDIIKRRYETRGKSQWVFNGAGQAGHLVEPGRGVEKVIEESGVEFILHDLRRTFVTYAERLDVPHYALKRLVNHKLNKSDVTSGYIGNDVKRLRDPMQAIANEINSHIG